MLDKRPTFWYTIIVPRDKKFKTKGFDTMEKKKLVKRDYFTALLSHVNKTGFATENITAAEFEKFLTNELNLLAKKNAAERKPTAKDMEKVAIANEAYDLMEKDTLYTVSQILKLTPSMADFTNQRAYGIVKVMMAEGLVKNIKDKNKSYFSKI